MNVTPIPWLETALRDIGQRETLGPNDSPWIRAMLARLPGGGSWLFGQPWCGGAVAHWMRQCDIEIPGAWYRARAWLAWGVPVSYPARGCVAVFERGGGGHVGIVNSIDRRSRVLVVGGNQGNAVRIDPFDTDRVLGYRWPASQLALLPSGSAPYVAFSGASSRNEA